MREFVAVDGEGESNVDGVHVYTLLAASSETTSCGYIENYSGNGLDTLSCLDFLLRLRKPGRILISFSFSYDVNMILRDINSYAFKSLKDFGFCHIGSGKFDGLSYRLEYIKGKFLTLSYGREIIKSDGSRLFRTEHDSDGLKLYVKIFDTFGFFQTSFVNALEEWQVATADELTELIEMKGERSAFDKVDKTRIREYNLIECKRLCTIVSMLDEKCKHGLGINLSSFHGAGAIGSALLRKNKAQNYLPKHDDKPIRHAFFGGRIQVLKIGKFKDVYSYDIRSAYPAILSNCPLFDIGKALERVDTIEPFDIIRVRWSLPKSTIIAPFPFRLPDGSIQYYRSGEGYYHASEVLAGLRYYSEYIEVVEIWRIRNNDNFRPFEWLEDLYEYRKEVRAAGDLAHIAIKLGLNSVYGKTAQKIGFRGSKPPYKSLTVAGMITAGTRAMMFDAAMQNPESIIMFATDGLASTEKLDLNIGTGLGQWDEERNESLKVYQPGLYLYSDKECYRGKTRSIYQPDKKRRYDEYLEFWAKIERAFDSEGVNAKIEFVERHFITFGIASEKLPWRTWHERAKTLSLKPTKGFPFETIDGNYDLKPLECPYDSLSKEYGLAEFNDEIEGIL